MRKILYSPGYGAGWVTWNREYAEVMLTYQPIIEFIEAGNKFDDEETRRDKTYHPLLQQLQNDLIAKYGKDAEYAYFGGARDLEVAEVPGRVRINEYDGNESLEFEDEAESQWL